MDIIRQFQQLLNVHKNYKNFSEITINSVQDIAQIPFTTRQDIEHYDLTKSPETPRFISNTSGTSGAPTIMSFSKQALESLHKRFVHLVEGLGAKKGDGMLVIFDDPRAYSCAISCDLAVIYSDRVSKETLDLIKFKVEKLRPAIVIGFATAIYDLLVSLNKPGIFRKIMLGGIPVLPEMHQQFEKLAGCPVTVAYGASEFGYIALKRQYHDEWYELSDHGLFLELIDEKRQIRQQGKGLLVITDLFNYSMPFVRYIIGDYVELRRTGDRVYIKLLGRKDDYIKIEGDVIKKQDLVNAVSRFTGHDNFCIIVSNEEMQDKLSVLLPHDDTGKATQISDQLKHLFDVIVEILPLEDEPDKSLTGKRINVVDKRDA